MRILTVSNFYPPYYVGGYELACQDVVKGLRQRGHGVTVLTSSYGVRHPSCNDQIYRSLYAHWHTEPILPLWQFARAQYHDIRVFRRLINTFQPDVLHVWNMDRLGRPFLKAVASEGGGYTHHSYTIPAVFAISDWWVFNKDIQNEEWRIFWEHRPQNPIKRKVKSALKKWVAKTVAVDSLNPTIRHAHFFSQFLQQRYAEQGIIPESPQVIYHGVSSRSQSSDISLRRSAVPLKLLYSGQVLEWKGVHTAIEALAILKDQQMVDNFSLTIIGPQPVPAYVARLRRLLKEHHLESNVMLRKKVSRKMLEAVYQEHDVLLFPSIWDEPFSITILEAMANGLIVIATPTGGSAEILRHQENSLIFPANDGHQLANCLQQLFHDPALGRCLQENAIKTVCRNYSIEEMVDNIEHYLSSVLTTYRSK